MSFFVMLSPDAQDGLAAAWLDAPNRAAVTAPQAKIDHLLGDDPFVYGEPVSEDLYSISVPPLRALFYVNKPAKLVYVESIGVLRQKPSNGQEEKT
jgi:hypothetical protein